MHFSLKSSLFFSGFYLFIRSMQRRNRHHKVSFYLAIVLLISICVSLILVITPKKAGKFPLHFDQTPHISDRTVIFVRTSHNCQSRLTYLLQSWISSNLFEQKNLHLITDHVPRQSPTNLFDSFQNIFETKCPQTHNRYDLCCKTAHEFQLFYNLLSRKKDLQWMCRFDDDQYVNLDNLYKYLNEFNSSEPYYIGRTSISQRLAVNDDSRTYTFATYGAGVCFSRPLLEQLRPYANTKVLPQGCLKRGISDDAYVGYLIELHLNISLTSVNDLLHSHLEKLDDSFRYFSLFDLTRFISVGFAWDRYQLEWLPIIHQLIKLVQRNEIEAANRLWLFLRNYEKDHPENLANQYDQSCLSYQKLRNQSLETAKKNSERAHQNQTKT